VIYDRDGAPRRGIVLGRVESAERFVANMLPDRALLEAMVARELCGAQGKVECRDGSAASRRRDSGAAWTGDWIDRPRLK
jgi:hypothetical protein